MSKPHNLGNGRRHKELARGASKFYAHREERPEYTGGKPTTDKHAVKTISQEEFDRQKALQATPKEPLGKKHDKAIAAAKAEQTNRQRTQSESATPVGHLAFKKTYARALTPAPAAGGVGLFQIARPQPRVPVKPSYASMVAKTTK